MQSIYLVTITTDTGKDTYPVLEAVCTNKKAVNDIIKQLKLQGFTDDDTDDLHNFSYYTISKVPLNTMFSI